MAKRWKAFIGWKIDGKAVGTAEAEIEEISELNQIIEDGPAWQKDMIVLVEMIYLLQKKGAN